jgi:hypothetical protein
VIAYNSAVQPEGAPGRACADCCWVDLANPPRHTIDAPVVVVVGHSEPPQKLIGFAPEDTLSRLAALVPTPRLLVLDTCFGASASVLDAMVRVNYAPELLIASASRLPLTGYDYGEFWERVSSLPSTPSAGGGDPIFGAAAAIKNPALIGWNRTEIRNPTSESLHRVLAELHFEGMDCTLEAPFLSVSPNRLFVNDARLRAAGVDGPILIELGALEWCEERCAEFVTVRPRKHTTRSSAPTRTGYASSEGRL